MGMIQSVLCSLTYCLERVLTWTSCAFLLILIMFTVIALMVYGISVGYQYAQTEIVSIQAKYDVTLDGGKKEGKKGDGKKEGNPRRRFLRYDTLQPQLEVSPSTIYRIQGPEEDSEEETDLFLDKSESPVVLLQTEKLAVEPDMNEKDLVKFLIRRFRRSRNITDAPKYTRTYNIIQNVSIV